jgi:hypothetical protein
VGFSPAQSGLNASVFTMPLYFFRIQSGQFSGASDHGTELADHQAAWNELTSVCSDMASSISRKLKQNSEWQMELLDESKRPVFRIRIVGESLN